MAVKAVVFDFDGTLVDSADVKREGFYALAPDGESYRKAIAAVLDADPAASRYEVVPKIMSKLRMEQSISKTDELLGRYGEVVLKGVEEAREMPGAGCVLEKLSEKAEVYISSNTPREPLTELVQKRDWDSWLHGIYGYPDTKQDTLRRICSEKGFDPAEILVVGDAESDREAAEAVGCRFFRAGSESSLNDLLSLWKVDD